MKKILLMILVSWIGLSKTYSQVEMVKNGTFEDTLTYDDGYGFYSGSSTAPLLDNMRVDTVAYEGTHSVRVFDHTWGTFFWDNVSDFADNGEYTVTFWYKGAEPMKFSMFLGRDLGYDLGSDPEAIVPGNATVADDKTDVNAKVVWTLDAKTEWTRFSYTFRISNWLGKDQVSGDPVLKSCILMFENSSYAADDGAVSYIDNFSVTKKDMNELVLNGTFESPLSYGDGYGFYSGSANVPLLDNMRTDTVAYEGTHSVRIFDHLWGTFLWDEVAGFTDNSAYEVSFWYKGEEPINFSMFFGRDLKYDLATDPEHIVPSDAVVTDDGKGLENARVVWSLDKKTEWTKFVYNFNIGNWFGNDPESGEPNTGKCILMFESTSFIMDDGTSSYVDNFSVYKKGIPTSIPKIDYKAKIDIYPNPVAGSITLNGLNPGTQLKICSFSGQVINILRYNGQPIDVSSYDKGGYFIVGINSKGDQFVGKFIKQ
jgi:hypothetical protein